MSLRTNFVLLVLGYIFLAFMADSVQQFLGFVAITVVAGFVLAVLMLAVDYIFYKIG